MRPLDNKTLGDTQSDSAPPGEQDLLSPGLTLGRFVIRDVLGQGGMGVVYAAYDFVLDRKVALKVLREGRRERSSTDARAEVLSEAKAMARLGHPNIVAIHDLGTQGDRDFLAMELVDGGSLREWLRSGRRSWRDVVELLVQAGRGLAAAHAAGVIHRDFKADNVLLGQDGRPRVSDFGIARFFETAKTSPDANASSLEGTATTRAGSPPYMAPEQLKGLSPGPASDQYGFCATLHEALCGAPPFEGATAEELLKAMEKGPPRALGRARVPSWLRKAVLRGLSQNPADRFPSMQALLQVLQRGLHRRRNVRLASALAVCAAASISLTLLEGGRARAARCSTAAGPLVDAFWKPDRQTAIHRALLATKLPFAQASWETVQRGFSEFSTQFSAAFRHACEATWTSAVQSEALLDLRLSCLNEKLTEARAVSDVLAAADAKVTENAVRLAESLPRLESCSDAAWLRERVKPPDRPGTREAVAQVRASVARAAALYEAGKYAEGLQVARDADARARALQYGPLTAEAQARLGMLLFATGKPQEGADALADAAGIALASRHEEVAANAFAVLAWISGQRAESSAGMRWAGLAEPLIQRLPGNDRALGNLLTNRGLLSLGMGKPDEALAAFTRALELRTRSLGPTHPDVAAAHVNVGLAERKRGQLSSALSRYRQALTVFEHTYGPEHPQTARAVSNLGQLLGDLGHSAEALALGERALRVREQTLGPGHPDVAISLFHVGRALEQLGRFGDAQARYERALAIVERVWGAEHPWARALHSGLGTSLAGAGKASEGLVHARRAVALAERTPSAAAELSEALQSLGATELALGQLEAAARSFERARAALPPEPMPLRALVLGGLGEAQLGSGQRAQAQGTLDEADRLLEQMGASALMRAPVRFALARAQALQPENADRARVLAEEALSGYRSEGYADPRPAQRVAQWLSSRSRR